MTANNGGPYSERRSVPRYNFIATAEIIERTSNTNISGRVSEISSKGCYVDILNTLPKGTPIRVRITTDQGAFECAGNIIYVQDNMGMGIAFVDAPKDQIDKLESWLGVLGGQA
jgi:hypothetical protein